MSKRRKRAEEDAEERPYITRTERTRAATAVNKVAVRMAKLSPDELDQLALPENLRDAIDVYQKLKPRGRARQQRTVCQLLRYADHEAIIPRVEALEAATKRRNEREG